VNLSRFIPQPCIFYPLSFPGGLRSRYPGNIPPEAQEASQGESRKLLNLTAHVFTIANSKHPFFKTGNGEVFNDK
jgi:hypothetical protein